MTDTEPARGTAHELDSALTALAATGSAHLAALVEGLAVRADDAGLLDVAVRVVDSPFGPLLLAATSIGIVRLAFESEGQDQVLTDLARMVGPNILESPTRTDTAARQLDEYFAGQRRTFDLPIDLRLVQGFRHEVVRHLPDIPYGTTASYGQLAATLGNPRAVRAVGSACAHNPVPVIVPCHRVVRADGSIGNYLGGTDTKRALLDLEAR